MFSPPPDSGESTSNWSKPNIEEQYADLSQDRRRHALNRAKRWFFLLVGSGLALGVVVAVVIGQLLNNWGLTTKPNIPFQEQVGESRE